MSGNTKEYYKQIQRTGARWYGPKKVWSFYTENDPTEKILSSLPDVKKETKIHQDIDKKDDTGVKYNQEEALKEGENDEKADNTVLDTGDEEGTSDGRLSSGTDDDSVRSTRGESTSVPGNDKLQDTGIVSVQSGEHSDKDQSTNLPQTDSGLSPDKGSEGKTDGTDDSQDGQPRRDGENIDESSGGISEEGESKKNKVAYNNYRINEENPVFTKGSKKVRYKANIEALKTLQTILDEGRSTATIEEQRKLALYSGWGALPEVFDYTYQYGRMIPTKGDWANEFKETKELMDKLSETHFSGFFNYRGKLWENAKASTLNAHFTSPDIISLIYQAIEQMGYRKGTLLEPSMGTGNFFGMIPDNIVERTKLYGVELDPLTGSIAQLLYPNADIRIQGFQDVNYPDNYFDVAVGNVPFGNYKIADNKYPSFVTERIHNYFFAKTLDVVKPG